jgi:hypothetical protein
MGNRVNPLFIQKKDLNSDRLQLSFTIHRFSKAYLQRKRGPPLLQSISSAEKGAAPSPKHIFSGKGGRPFSKIYLQWRRGTCGEGQTATESSAIFIRIPRTGVLRRYSTETAAQKQALCPFESEHTSCLSSLHRPEFYLYSLLQFNRVKIGCLNLAYAN